MAFITKEEYESMLDVCSGPDPLALRDKMMLMILYNTGCRVSELVSLYVDDISVETDGTSSIRFMGKGRKERITPIWKSTAMFIDSYIRRLSLGSNSRLLSNNRNENLTRSGVGQRITTITEKAVKLCPSLKRKNVTPHTFRHNVAMNLLQADIDISPSPSGWGTKVSRQPINKWWPISKSNARLWRSWKEHRIVHSPTNQADLFLHSWIRRNNYVLYKWCRMMNSNDHAALQNIIRLTA